jgi:hypothetical protein
LVKKIEALEVQGIRVMTYSGLHKRASEYFAQIEENLRKEAPEFTRAARRKRKGKK